MAVSLRDLARDITVVLPRLSRLDAVDPLTVHRLRSTGLSVDLIAAMTGLSQDAVWTCLESADPRLGPTALVQHTDRTHALMRRWQRNTITLGQLINELADRALEGNQRPG